MIQDIQLATQFYKKVKFILVVCWFEEGYLERLNVEPFILQTKYF